MAANRSEREPSTTSTPDQRVDQAPLSTDRSRVDVVVMGAAVVAVWFLVVYLGRTWGIWLESQDRNIVLFTPPVLGGYRFDHDLRFVIPIVTAVVLVGALPALGGRLRWAWLLVVAWVGSLVWWVALALIDGPDALTRGLYWADDYAPTHAFFTSDPRQFLATFVDALPTYSIQLRAHPPGVPLVIAGLDRIGLGGETAMAVLTLAIAASGIVAVLIAVREVAGEANARRALPFLVLAPTATWMAITFDALFAGTAAWLVALLILAAKRSGRRADLLAIGAGLVAALSIMFSYGLVLMGLIVLAVAIALRAWRPLAIATVTAFVAVLAFVPFGFWWIGGLEATKVAYDTLDVDRPYLYFLFNNLSAWFLAIGPATLVALTFLRDRRLWIVVGGGLAAIVAADLTGLSSAEVERIWLPFTIWILPAAAVLGGRGWATRGWLGAQAASSIVLAWYIQVHW